MFTYSPNLWLVLAVAVVGVLIHLIWYGERGFGRVRAALTGQAAGRNLVALGLSLLVEGYVVAHMVYYVGAYNWVEGLQTGWWLWLGFVATILTITAVLNGQRFRLWLIDAGYQLIVLLVMAALLASW